MSEAAPGALRQYPGSPRSLGECIVYSEQRRGLDGTLWRSEHHDGLGNLHGECLEYNAAERLIRREHWFHGLRHREWAEFSPVLGLKTATTTWHLGQRLGPFKTWHANGQLATSGHYAHNRVILQFQRWDEKGVLVESNVTNPNTFKRTGRSLFRCENTGKLMEQWWNEGCVCEGTRREAREAPTAAAAAAAVPTADIQQRVVQSQAMYVFGQGWLKPMPRS